MIILAVKTDQPTAELHLFKDSQSIAQDVWQSDRQLEIELLTHIRVILEAKQLAFKDLNGLIFYQGPGSYTGLRIGATVINGLAQGLSLKTVSSSGKDWLAGGLKSHEQGSTAGHVTINYGSKPK